MEAQKQLTDYRYKLKKAEQDITALEGNVSAASRFSGHLHDSATRLLLCCVLVHYGLSVTDCKQFVRAHAAVYTCQWHYVRAHFKLLSS